MAIQKPIHSPFLHSLLFARIGKNKWPLAMVAGRPPSGGCGREEKGIERASKRGWMEININADQIIRGKFDKGPIFSRIR